MIGLQAISANNGWSMAFVGALIVMCGLASLSFIISQLHKIIGLFEKKLVKLYEIFERENLPHPHLTISAFRDAGYLIPLGSGLFSWQKV
ncbi:MAG: OadG family protein [Desulfobulbaceae bacterium]